MSPAAVEAMVENQASAAPGAALTDEPGDT